MSKKRFYCLQIFVLLFLFSLNPKCSNKPDNDQCFHNPGEKWESRMGRYANKYMEIRINTALKNTAQTTSFNYQIAAGIIINNPMENGLPDETEQLELKRVERFLIEKLVKSGLALYALNIKTDKRCDFIFYGADKSRIHDTIASIGQRIGNHAVDITIKRDPKWNTYKWFALFGIAY